MDFEAEGCRWIALRLRVLHTPFAVTERGSGKEARSPEPPPLRTVQAGFLAYGSSMEQRILTTRGVHPGPGRSPARYCYRAGSRCDTVVAAAPATTVTVAPTDLRRCPTPVGCRFTGVHTRGKSARFPVG